MPNNNNVNLYGGRRGNNNQPKLRQGQVKRIVALLVTLVLLLNLHDFQTHLTPNNAVKYRSGAFKAFMMFVNIAKTIFAGHTEFIEAGAASVVSVVARKFQTGRLKPNIANLAVATTAFTLAYRSKGAVSPQTIANGLATYRNSIPSRVLGHTAKDAENVRNAMLAMIAWLVSSLNYFAVQNVKGVIQEELRVRGVKNTTKNVLMNAGAEMLRLVI